VAVWLERRSRRFLREALALVLVVLAAAPLLANATRPLLPRPGNVLTTDRIGLLFAARKADRASYEEVSAAIRERRSRSVGLVVEVGDWEYPFWVLLGRRADRPRIEHVSIPAPRSAHSVAVGSLETLSPEVDPAFQPDVIVRDLFSDGGPPGPASFRYRRGVYRLEMAAGSLRLFVLDAPGGLDLGANH
jgi:hypothetical protein